MKIEQTGALIVEKSLLRMKLVTLQDWHILDLLRLDDMIVTFGASSSWLNVKAASPEDSTSFTLSSAWDYAGYIPKIGTTITIAANAYSALQNTDPDIFSEQTKFNTRVYQLKKHVRYLDKAPDLPYSTMSYSDSEEQTSGGLTYWFDYEEYTAQTSATVFAKGQAIYFGSADVGYPMGWYFTPEVTYTWDISLPSP